jgi:hypothetical protein
MISKKFKLSPKVFTAYRREQEEKSRQNRLLTDDEIQRVLRSLDKTQENFWLVECYVSARVSMSGEQFVKTVTFPGENIPVVRVGDCAIESRHYVEILKIILERANPDIKFGLSLTTRAMLDGDGNPWYEWGDPIVECVCSECGAVFMDTNPLVRHCPSCASLRLTLHRLARRDASAQEDR